MFDSEQPIREIRPVASIRASDHAVTSVIGSVYSVEFADGNAREVFVWRDNLWRDGERAVFLKPGRRGEMYEELRTLIIGNAEDAVPHHLKERLRQSEEERKTHHGKGQGGGNRRRLGAFFPTPVFRQFREIKKNVFPYLRIRRVQ